jgi:quinol monooxygenase YgiN
MLSFCLRIKIPRKQRKDFLDSASLIQGPTEVQTGCISCRLYQEVGDPDTVLLMEEWESQKALERHIKSDQYRIILSLMDLSEKYPEVKLNTISKTEGLEAIEKVRNLKEYDFG